MASLHRNFLSGTITNNPLVVGSLTANSASFANLPAVVSPDYMWLVLDPTAVAGAPEIVQVTAHVAATSVLTIVRAQQSTVARQHLVNTIWRAVFTQTDSESSLLAKSDVATGDLLYASSATATARLAVGAATAVLHGGSTPSYSQIVAGDIASDAVTTVKILDANVTQAKLAGNLPRGIVGEARGTTQQTGITTTPTDLTGMTVTFTAVAGRKYKVSFDVPVLQVTTAANVIIRLLEGGVEVHRRTMTLAVSDQAGMVLVCMVTPAAGSVTYKLDAQTTAGTLTARPNLSIAMNLIVEDVGGT